MKPTDFIRENEVFTTKDALRALGDGQATYNALHLAVKSGRVKQIRRGLYASSYGRYEGHRADALSIAVKAADDAVLCHGSAYSFFAAPQDIEYVTSFYTARNMAPFTFEGMRYVPYHIPPYSLDVRQRLLSSGVRATATSREQTIADSLSRPDRSGGLEAVFRRLSVVEYVDSDLLCEIAASVGPSCCARLGWLLERKAEEWGVPDRSLSNLRRAMTSGPYYYGNRSESTEFDASWRIYLPEKAETMEAWLNG